MGRGGTDRVRPHLPVVLQVVLVLPWPLLLPPVPLAIGLYETWPGSQGQGRQLQPRSGQQVLPVVVLVGPVVLWPEEEVSLGSPGELHRLFLLGCQEVPEPVSLVPLLVALLLLVPVV